MARRSNVSSYTNQHRYETFATELNEYLDMGIRNLSRIAEGMHLQRDSLLTKLRRHGLHDVLLEYVPVKLSGPQEPVRLVLFVRADTRAPGWSDHTRARYARAYGPGGGHSGDAIEHDTTQTEHDGSTE